MLVVAGRLFIISLLSRHHVRQDEKEKSNFGSGFGSTY